MEVDAPGCSFNPDRGQHQDAVAAAVAAEVRKALQRDLAAQPPPRTVDWQPETDPLALLQARRELFGDHAASLRFILLLVARACAEMLNCFNIIASWCIHCSTKPASCMPHE